MREQAKMKKAAIIAFAFSCLSATAIAQAASPDDRLARGRAVEAVILRQIGIVNYVNPL
jgi:hypothetical protein